jgi:uncharacterized protein YjiS (DUF1127 family)
MELRLHHLPTLASPSLRSIAVERLKGALQYLLAFEARRRSVRVLRRLDDHMLKDARAVWHGRNATVIRPARASSSLAR